MNRFTGYEIAEYTPSFCPQHPCIFASKTRTLTPHFPSFSLFDELDFTLDLLNPNPIFSLSSPFHDFDTITDLIQIETTPLFHTSTRQIKHRVDRLSGHDLYLNYLSDRVSDLELSFDKLIHLKTKATKKIAESKYTWTAEIKDTSDRKCKWTAEIKGGKKGKGGGEKSYKWMTEIKGKGDEVPISRTYTFKESTGGAGECIEKKEKKEKKAKSEKEKGGRIVEIEEPSGHGVCVLRQAFAKRTRKVEKSKGKRKVLLPHDAAMMIQMSFRAYLIRRSQTLRALRELAIAKTKLKEIRALFNNFTYRRHVARDAEERQRFSERIIVLLLTVDAIEGADMMVRSAKRSMVDELEAMLDVIDPQPAGKSLSFRRRTFDVPDGVIQKELAAGVAQVVQMLDQDSNGAETFEACL